MKKYYIFAIILLMPLFAFAAKSDAGLTPSSRFYFLDTLFEKIDLSLTFNSEKKAQKALKYADERLAEAEVVVEEKNTNAIKTAIAGYESSIALASEESKQIKNKEKTDSIRTSIFEKTLKHQEILSDVLSKVSDETKEAITKAVEVSKKGQEEATKQTTEPQSDVEQSKKEISGLKEETKSISVNQTNNQESEIEKLKREVQNLKNKTSDSQSIENRQKQPSITVQEIPKQKQNYDQELSQMIAEIKQRIGVFNEAIKETTNFIPIVKTDMNKYQEDPLAQQSGQELINENNNLASISKKLISIETELVNKLSSYLGLGVLPSTDIFSQITQQYNDYYQQYEASNARIESLMRTFVENGKSVLEKRLTQEKQSLEELKQLISQEMAARKKQLADLGAKIEFEQKRYDTACEGVSMSFCAGQRAYIASHDLNPLINEYNALLGNTSGKIYSPVKQTYLKFEADQFGGGGRLYDPNGSTYYTFDCDQSGNCSIYGN